MGSAGGGASPAETALLLVLFALVGVAVVPAHRVTIWMDPEFTGWVVPIANRITAGQRLYAPGLHSPLPPLPFLLARGLFGTDGRWIHESALNYTFQCLALLVTYAGLAQGLRRPLPLLATLAAFPVFLALPKSIAYDAMAQCLAAATAVLAAGALRPGPRAMRGPGPAWLTAVATALLLLTKQSTALGAVAGVGAAWMLWPAALPWTRRVRRLLAWGLSSLALAALAAGLLAPWAAPRGLVVDVFLTGSEPKGSAAHLLASLAGFAAALGRDLALLLPAALLVARAAFGRPLRPPWARGPRAGRAVPALAAALALVWVAHRAWTGASPAVSLVTAGLAIAVACAVLAVAWRPAPATSPGATLGLFTVLLLPPALFHNLSVTQLRWTYDNNPLIVVALAALLTPAWIALDLASEGRRRAARAVLAAGVLALGVSFGLSAASAVRRCTETWPEVAHLAGARMPPRGEGLREVVARVRELAGPRDRVLLLPDDPNVEAWFERPRPHLSSAIVFVDQYWDRYVDEDFAALRRDPPRVIVIGPRDLAMGSRRIAFWRVFFSAWQRDSGAERLIDRVTRELLPAAYGPPEGHAIALLGSRARLDVYVRRDPPPPGDAAPDPGRRLPVRQGGGDAGP